MRRVSSYDPTARTPAPGSRWVWEIDKPHARALIEVIETWWNGEEWWVHTRTLLPNLTYPLTHSPTADDHWNDLSRFCEAVTPVGAALPKTWLQSSGTMQERR